MHDIGDIKDRVYKLDIQVQNLLSNFDDLEKVFPSIRDVTDLEQKIAILETEVEVIKGRLDKKIESNEFMPVRMIAYGLAAAVLLGFVAALLKVVSFSGGAVIPPNYPR
jgi:regulator of replication initiation timing